MSDLGTQLLVLVGKDRGAVKKRKPSLLVNDILAAVADAVEGEFEMSKLPPEYANVKEAARWMLDDVLRYLRAQAGIEAEEGASIASPGPGLGEAPNEQ